MSKRVIFISNSIIPKKDAGGGSVIIYRHLKQLEQNGFKIIIVFLGKGVNYIDGFQYIYVEKKWWYPFLRKRTPFFSAITMSLYLKVLLKKLDLIYKNDITLGLLGEIPNLLQLKIFNKKKVPFFLFYHDDTLFNRYWLLNPLGKRQIKAILSKATFIFSVSQQMVNLLRERKIAHTKVLYPIPESYNGAKKSIGHHLNKLNFCYAGMALHIHFDILDNISQGLKNLNNDLYCVTGPLEGFQPKHADNIIIKPRFDTVNNLFGFMLAEIDVNIIFYSFSLQHEPRMETSFPSKFVEYAQLGIPIVIIAPEFSSLGKWAINKNWLSYISSDKPADIEINLKKFHNADYWQKCQDQVLECAANEFNPCAIQKSFTDTIYEVMGNAS